MINVMSTTIKKRNKGEARGGDGRDGMCVHGS